MRPHIVVQLTGAPPLRIFASIDRFVVRSARSQKRLSHEFGRYEEVASRSRHRCKAQRTTAFRPLLTPLTQFRGL